MVELIRFSDLPGMIVYTGLVVGVFWLGHWVWQWTGAQLWEWWLLRKATRLEDYEE